MRRRFASEGFPVDQVELQFSAEVRFQSQSSEVRVPLSDPNSYARAIEEMRERFAAEYERLYGHTALLSDPIEVVAIRLVGRLRRSMNASLRAADEGLQAKGSRRAYFDGQTVETPVVTRAALALPAAGPLLVDEYDSTTVVPPGTRARLDQHQNILLEPCHD